jgi:Sugar (and other) transporter
MFYGSTLFKGVSLDPTMVTFLIGLVNFLSTLVGLILLSKAGRKILMIVGSGS